MTGDGLCDQVFSALPSLPSFSLSLHGSRMRGSLDFAIWECVECGHRGKFPRAAVQERLGEDLTLATIAAVMNEARCTRCRGAALRAWAPDGDLLLDPERAVPCQGCGLAIPLPRLKARPEGRLCVLCAEAGERIVSSEAPWPGPPSELKRCPRCGRGTVLQRPRSGRPFVGCMTFPECWWRAELSRSQEFEVFGAGGYDGWVSRQTTRM